jgi:hypothetical protein
MEGMYRAFKYCGYYYSTPESDGLWSYVGDQLLDIARILSVGFLDTLVIGYGTDQISPQTLEPKFSVIGFSDINGRNSYTYGNYRLVDGLHVNVFRDTSDNYQRKIDFIAVGDQDGSAGGAEFRFFCNNETSDTAKPAMILTNKKIKVVGLSYEDTQITTGTSGVTTDLFRFLDINGSVLTGVKCGTMWITCVNSGGETTTVYFVFMKDALHDYSMNSMASASMGGINVVADGSGHKIQTTMPATSGTNTYVTKFSGIVYR